MLSPVYGTCGSVTRRSGFLPNRSIIIVNANPLKLFSMRVTQVVKTMGVIIINLRRSITIHFPITGRLNTATMMGNSARSIITHYRRVYNGSGLKLIVRYSNTGVTLGRTVRVLHPGKRIMHIKVNFGPLSFSVGSVAT